MPPRYDWAPLQAALSAEQRKLIEDYLDQLLDYNGKVNLTAPTDPQNLLLRHVADGLAAVKVLKEHLSAPAPKILDLGCGGGVIGMTIEIA